MQIAYVFLQTVLQRMWPFLFYRIFFKLSPKRQDFREKKYTLYEMPILIFPRNFSYSVLF